MSKAFQDVNIRIAYISPIPISAKDDQILTELKNLTSKETKVYLVHMNPSLGYRLYALAKNSGMMSEGYGWLISDSLSISLDSIDSVTRDSMEGVVGVRPYVHRSKELENFEERWRRNMILEKKTLSPISMGLNIYGLWAYDAVTSLAIAVENIGPVNSNSFYVNGTYNNYTDLRISAFGPRLANELSRTKFRGLTGDFELIDGKMKLSAFEIFNVIGSGEKTVGFWTRDRGITRELKSTSTKELKNIIWPGDNITLPKVLDIIAARNLRVGVPWKSGFQEFVNVAIDHKTNITNATGFAIDIFLATLKQMLPISINFDYHMYNDTNNTDWSYDDMLQELPKPLKWDLWLAIIGTCILVGIVVRILEDQGTRNGTEDHLINERPAAGMVYLSSVVVLAFPERNMVSNNWSIVVLVFWLFMAFILMQSYTANLAAILTVDHLKFAFSDNYCIGYQKSSFMRKYLVEDLNISESRLRNYTSVEAYHHAMSLGSEKGGIDAIFDEIPYMKIFMNTYDSQYKMVGPTYKTGGFGFAFPHGSPLVVSFSKAILDVTQGPDMTFIEQKNFRPGYSSQDPLSSTISQGASSLTFSEFAGLFLIIGSVILFALFCSETPIGRKFIEKMGIFVHVCFSSRTSRVDSIEKGREEENSHESMRDNVASLPLGEGMDGVPHDFNGDVYQHSETEIRETITSDGPFATHDFGVPIDNNREATKDMELIWFHFI
ncbi:hypothetical protein RD792_012543 [Penstemon davidsonii]|uniref:Ionotropic glutamate receptor C-terminal domain-containing protein n=1 Tax=Penstemon davidsonii TaxID=160366 RepID=A0ABR0CXI9_9LAMI|nr:hypothetical protein RD792_012543 [Penstemon davidsonii]